MHASNWSIVALFLAINTKAQIHGSANAMATIYRTILDGVGTDGIRHTYFFPKWQNYVDEVDIDQVESRRQAGVLSTMQLLETSHASWSYTIE